MQRSRISPARPPCASRSSRKRCTTGASRPGVAYRSRERSRSANSVMWSWPRRHAVSSTATARTPEKSASARASPTRRFSSRHSRVSCSPTKPGHRPHRHLPRQRHHQRLEPRREAAAGLRPRHLRLLHAARRTPHPRHPGVQVGAVLEEVQVTPALRARVVRLAAPPPARGAVERPARLEVQVQVQAALGRVELRPLHPPRPPKTQRPLEQSPLRHAAVPPGRSASPHCPGRPGRPPGTSRARSSTGGHRRRPRHSTTPHPPPTARSQSLLPPWRSLSRPSRRTWLPQFHHMQRRPRSTQRRAELLVSLAPLPRTVPGNSGFELSRVLLR